MTTPTDFKLITEHYTCYWQASLMIWAVMARRNDVIVARYETLHELLEVVLLQLRWNHSKCPDDQLLMHAIEDVLAE